MVMACFTKDDDVKFSAALDKGHTAALVTTDPVDSLLRTIVQPID